MWKPMDKKIFTLKNHLKFIYIFSDEECWSMCKSKEHKAYICKFFGGNIYMLLGVKKDWLTVKRYSETCFKQSLKNRQNKGLKDKW